MELLWRDLKSSVRNLLKSPGFFIVAILILALGFGANSAIFSLVNAVLLRPFPYADPERLVLVWESAPFFGVQDSPVAPGNYQEWRARSRSFSGMGAIESRSYRLTGTGRPEVLEGSLVTSSLFRTLGIRPLLGRVFLDEEDQPGAAKVAVLSFGLWQRGLGGDPGVIGKTITLNDQKHLIVGVLAPGTEIPTEYGDSINEIWTPFGTEYGPAGLVNRNRHNWMVIARLRSGITLEQANQEIVAIGQNLAREYPETNAKVGAFVAPLREHFVGSGRRVLLILLVTVVFVLLIACSNLANLLLSRAAGRSKEAAVRLALGANTIDLMRQFFCESLLLCAVGGVFGILLATSTFGFLAHLAPGTVTGLKELTIDWRVLAYTLGISALATLAFSLVPLLQFRRLDLSHSLKQGARTLAAGTGSPRVRALLISSEVALAFILSIGAGLLIRTFAHLRAVEVGFQTKNILTLRIPPAEKDVSPQESLARQREILQRVNAIPGVASVGFTNHIPIMVKGDINQIRAEGRSRDETFQVNSRSASPDYMRTMGIPLLRGRYLEERDQTGDPSVAVVNETLARALWPNQDPLGRQILIGDDLRLSVVGVVGDIHQEGLDVPPNPEYYVVAKSRYLQSSLAIRTLVDPNSVVPAVRKAIWSLDPEQPITDVATMEEILDKEVFQRRVQTTLLAAFAGLALLLAAVGLYGVLAYLVSRQVPEIGIRLALGATPSHILRRVVGHVLQLTLVGLCVGVAGGLALSRVLNSVLFGIAATDPATYAVVALLLLLTAIMAGYVPARRAMQVDPIVALREE
jgi:putative ABC transport system permease protein